MPSLDHVKHVNIAFEKDVSDDLIATVTVPAGADGEDGAPGVGIPEGGDEFDNLEKASAASFDARWAPSLAVLIERVAGLAGYKDVSGSVTLDLSEGRNHLLNVVGNVTSVSLTNLPSGAVSSPDIALAIKFADPAHLFSSFLSGMTVKWVDGRGVDDLDRSGVTNLLLMKVVGDEVYIGFAWNGELELPSREITLLDNGTLPVAVGDENLDLANVVTATGDGTLAFNKNGGSALSVKTAFAEGDTLNVVVTGLTTPTAIRIPRFAL